MFILCSFKCSENRRNRTFNHNIKFVERSHKFNDDDEKVGCVCVFFSAHSQTHTEQSLS